MYAASDALSQCVEFLRAQDTGGRRRSRTGRRHIFLDLARMARSGFTSGLLSGFLAVFYFAWLDRTWQPANLLGVLGQPHSDSAQRRAQWACVAGKVATDVGIYEPICKRTPSYCLRASSLTARRASLHTPSLPSRSACRRHGICHPSGPAARRRSLRGKARGCHKGSSCVGDGAALLDVRRHHQFLSGGARTELPALPAASCPNPTCLCIRHVVDSSPGDLLSITRCLDPQSLRLRPLTNALMSIPWGMYISSVANN